MKVQIGEIFKNNSSGLRITITSVTSGMVEYETELLPGKYFNLSRKLFNAMYNPTGMNKEYLSRSKEGLIKDIEKLKQALRNSVKDEGYRHIDPRESVEAHCEVSYFVNSRLASLKRENQRIREIFNSIRNLLP